MSSVEDIMRLTGRGRVVATTDPTMHENTAIELARIFDAIDQALDELRD
ncbi:MAG: hypothetical protein ACRDPQ_03555 [Nocardioidaceae bacterium]